MITNYENYDNHSKRKGFSLIELLAVIVILALIALIAIPIVGNIVEVSRKESIKINSNNYLRILEENVQLKLIDEELDSKRYEVIKGGKYLYKGEEESLDMKGDTPDRGTVCVDDNGKVDSYSIVINGYVVSNTRGTVKMEKGEVPLNITCDVTKETIEIEIPENNLICSKNKTISIKYPDYEEILKEYKIDDGKWNIYKEPFVINKNSVIYARLRDDRNDKVSAAATFVLTKVDNEKIDTTLPKLNLSIENPTKEIIATFMQKDNCGIDNKTIEYAISESKSGPFIYQKSNIFKKLKNNTTYYIRTKANDIAGNGISESEVSSIKTEDFKDVVITSNKTTWETKKTYTVTGTQAGTTLKYKVVNNNEIKTFPEWTDINNNGTFIVDWMSTINNPTYIYAILTDGDNISKASTYTETHIDTTASSKDMPSVISSPTNPTKAVVLTNNQKDNESGIKEIEYGYSKTKDGEYNWTSKNTISGLTQDKTYYFKTRVINNAKIGWTESEAKEFRITKMNICSIDITDKGIWKAKKVVTISGDQTGVELEYKIVNANGNVVKQDWKAVKSGATHVIDFESTINNPTYIYCKMSDGTNVLNGATYTETHIDITEATKDSPEVIESKTNPTKEVVMTRKQYDPESGLSEIEFGYSETKTGSYNWNKNNIKTDLVQGKTYYFKTRVKNGAGLGFTESNITEYTVPKIAKCFVDVNYKGEWKTSKTATITSEKTQAGVNLQYKIVSGTTVKQDWTTIKTGFTKILNWNATIKEPTNIYCRMVDGKSVVDGSESYTETHIDTTEASTMSPVVAPSSSNPTKEAVVESRQEDLESGIKEIEYGYSKTKDGTYIWNTNKIKSNLINGETYYFKTRVKNGSGIGFTESEVTEYTPVLIKGCNVDVNYKGEWKPSKTATITAIESQSGVDLEYMIKNNDEIKQDWTKINSGSKITINYLSTTSNVTTIYCRMTDKVSIKSGSTSAETHIDPTEADKIAPLVEPSSSNPTKEAIIKSKQSDLESGIKEIEYGYSETEGGTYDWNSKNSRTNLKQGKTYYFKTRVKNGAGLGFTESVATQYGAESIPKCTVTISDQGIWKASKTATIIGNKTGVSLQFRAENNGTIVKDWTTVSNGYAYKIDFPSNIKAPTSVTCRMVDGINIKEGETVTETHVDTTEANNTKPSVVKDTSKPTSVALVTNNQSDQESGIKEIEYGYSLSEFGTYTYKKSNKFEQLKQNTTYYFKTRVKNNAGLGYTESLPTSYIPPSIKPCSIKITDQGIWKPSKTVTISSSEILPGVTMQYRIINGTTVKNDWTNISNGGTVKINYASNINTPTSITCRMIDDTSVIDGSSSLTETHIDVTEPNKTAPSVAESSTSPTKEAVVTIKQVDNESGIDKDTIQYGYSTTENGTYTYQKSNVIKNLSQGATYYIKTKVNNVAGLGPTISNAATYKIPSIPMCMVNISDYGVWKSSKTITITTKNGEKVPTGSNLQYRITSGSTEKNSWTNISKDGKITLNWAANINVPTSVYCRIIDGTNTVNGTEVLTETHVDITEATKTVPVIQKGSSEASQAIVTLKQTDSESGVNSSSVEYGYSAQENGTYTWTTSNKITNLSHNKTYYFKTRVKNNAGLGPTESQNPVPYNTTGIPKCSVNISDYGIWKSSKKVSITGVAPSGVAIQYKIVSGTTTKTNWTNYNSSSLPIINWAANINIPTYVYCRMIDTSNSSNVVDGESKTETHIDITEASKTNPTGAPSSSNPTSAITLTSNQADSESGVDKTTIQYGYSDTVNGTYTYQASNTFTGLKQNKGYYFKTRVKNNAGLGPTESNASGAIAVDPLATCSININPPGWAPSKTVTFKLSKVQPGVTMQYKFVNNGKVIKDWTNISNNGTATINWISTKKIPTYVYCRTVNNVETLSGTTYTETSVDPTPALVTAPSVSASTTNPTSAMIISNKQTDEESGINKIQYGYSKTKDGAYDWNDSNTRSGLVQNTTYYIKTRVINGSGLGYTESLPITYSPTKLSSCGISITNPGVWKYSKTATITGSQSGVTLQYKVVSGTTTKVDWTTISSGSTKLIDWNANTTTPTYIYCRMLDGTNVNNGSTLTETHIDRNGPTIPEVTYNSGANTCTWKNNYNLTLTSTAASGIARYEIDYDNNGTVDATTSSNYIPSNGVHYHEVRFRSVDNIGISSGWTPTTHHIHQDTEAPAKTTVTYNSGSNTCSWKNNYNLSLSASDNVGIAYYEIDWTGDGKVDTTIKSSNFIPWNGYSSCNTRFKAVDYAGNRGEWSDSQHIHMDTEQPGTVNVAYNSGSNTCSWKNNYNLSLSASDNVGIAYYLIDWTGDGNANGTTAANFIPGNGHSSCNNRFKAVDHAGNVSANWTSSHHIHQDTEPPSTPIIHLSNASGEWANSSTATASSSDNVGVAGYEYSHDTNGVAGFPNPWTINWDGQWNFYVRSYDHAGNRSAWASPYTLRVGRSANVSYSTYYANGGTLNASDGALSGYGNATAMYRITINASSPSGIDGNVQYNVHRQTYGWSGWQNAGTTQTTSPHGERRIEAVEIKLTGNMANLFDVYYTGHMQSVGDLGWARNGDTLGSTGLCKRLEKIAIRIIPKDADPASYGISYNQGSNPSAITVERLNALNLKTSCETAPTCNNTCYKQVPYSGTCYKYRYSGNYSNVACGSGGTKVSVSNCGGNYASCCRYSSSYACTKYTSQAYKCC